jgi:hypothetical protein
MFLGYLLALVRNTRQELAQTHDATLIQKRGFVAQLEALLLVEGVLVQEKRLLKAAQLRL